MNSNADTESAIMAKLPATYGQLCNVLGWAGDRKIDAALQRLRRRGEIKSERKGRETVWMKADEVSDPVPTLVEFFRYELATDAASVGGWLAQGGIDADKFVADLDRRFPRRAQGR